MIETLGGVPGQREAPGRHEREGEGSPIPPAEGGTPKGPAVAMFRHAISKAAISVAADLRDTLAAGAMGAA